MVLKLRYVIKPETGQVEVYLGAEPPAGWEWATTKLVLDHIRLEGDDAKGDVLSYEDLTP